jgi:hypothetical protein
VRTSVDNPFTPGSDAVPAIWAGRTTQLSDWRDVLRPRRVAGVYERGRTILGEPGLGKSALVRRIAQDAIDRGDWVTPQLRMPLGADPLKLVAAAMLSLADAAGLATSREQRIRALLDRVQTVAASGTSLTLHRKDGPEPFAALTELLVELGTAAIARGTAVLIHIDEVQNIDDQGALSQLLIALGDALAHTVPVDVPGDVVDRCLPIAVYLTGLPDFEDMAGARKGATFARRFKTTTLSAIDDDDLRAALQPFVLEGWPVAAQDGTVARIRMEPRAVATVVEVSRGEPFLFQLAGEGAWNAGTGTVITVEDVRAGWRLVHGEAVGHVERILARLPQRERDFVEAMAALPDDERTLTRIADAAGFAKTSDAGTTSSRLDRVRGIIDRGRPYAFRHRALEAYLTSDWPTVADGVATSRG